MLISAAFPYDKRRVRGLGSEMACVEAGVGDAIAHWIPTTREAAAL